MEYQYKSVIVAVLVSLCAVPFVRAGLSHPDISRYLPMYILNYALVVTALVFFLIALPPVIECTNFGSLNFLGRNEIFYGCCIFMCTCLGGATLQAWRFNKLGASKVKHKPEFFAYDEFYMLSPFGMSSEIWSDGINYIFYALILFMIDNNIMYRDVALYWSGGTLTGELVATMAAFTGSHSDKLKYSEFMRIVYIAAAMWVIFKLVVLKPRCIPKSCFYSEYRHWDKALIIALVFLSVFAGIRGLAALSGNQMLVKRYATLYEPSIRHPSKFGVIWILYTAVYGIPFQLSAAYALTGPGAQWLIDMSVLYAASVLQGTFVFMSYSFYPSADKSFQTPKTSMLMVYSLNILLVVVAHVLMYRCLKEQCFFHKRCLKIRCEDPCLKDKASDDDDSDC